MIEKIEAKIESHVKSILKKDSIDFFDYQILVGEIKRQSEKQKADKWNAEKEQRNEAMMNMLKTAMNA